MLQKILRSYFAKIVYPTISANWYNKKGYKGENSDKQFTDFLATQSKKNALFYQEFKSLKLTQQYINSGSNKLDSVLLTPDKSYSTGKPGTGLYFLMFFGSREYYEGRFRDMARQAKATGASVLGFNPKGVNQSTGKTQQLNDIVDDGIAALNYLLQLGISHNQIILQGNSLGAGVQEMVSKHFLTNYGMRFRQINSNSFKTLSAVIAERYRMPFLEVIFSYILQYARWEFTFDSNFYQTGPYRCYMRRKGDKTIVKGAAEYHSMVDPLGDYNNCLEIYRETNKWLNEHSQLIYLGQSKMDPHDLGLHRFKINKGKRHSVYHFINRYLEASNRCIH